MTKTFCDICGQPAISQERRVLRLDEQFSAFVQGLKNREMPDYFNEPEFCPSCISAIADKIAVHYRDLAVVLAGTKISVVVGHGQPGFESPGSAAPAVEQPSSSVMTNPLYEPHSSEGASPT